MQVREKLSICIKPVHQSSAVLAQEATSSKTKQNQVLQRWGITTTSFFLLSLIRKSTVLHFPQAYIYLDINKIYPNFSLPTTSLQRSVPKSLSDFRFQKKKRKTHKIHSFQVL
jgi:hypothetical protein